MSAEDGGRFAPEKLAVFQAHQRVWQAGQIRLEDFATVREDGTYAWYPKGIQDKIDATFRISKAAVFDVLGYQPGIPQARFHASTARFKVFSGGARAGKSKAGAMEVVPILMTPGTNTWLVAPEYEQAEKEYSYVVGALIEHPILGPAWKKYLTRYFNRPSGGAMEIVFDYGSLGKSFLKVKSAKRMESLLSEELDCVVICEASLIPERAWKRMLKMRLATRHGMALFPSSPSGMGWAARIYQDGIAGVEGHFSVNCDSRMNPTQDLEEIKFLAYDLSDEDWNEQIEGRPVPRHGLVYNEFNYKAHCESWQQDWPKKSWAKCRGIDFGHVDPAVILWCARDEDGRFYIYREWYQKRRLVSDMVREIATTEGWEPEITPTGKVHLRGRPRHEEVTGYTWCDWDAAGRAELHLAGPLCVRKADKDILDGIASVRRNFRLQADGRPRIYINPNCRELIRELQAYEWDGAKDQPATDQSDHALDTMRYVIHSLDPKGIALKMATS